MVCADRMKTNAFPPSYRSTLDRRGSAKHYSPGALSRMCPGKFFAAHKCLKVKGFERMPYSNP